MVETACRGARSVARTHVKMCTAARCSDRYKAPAVAHPQEGGSAARPREGWPAEAPVDCLRPWRTGSMQVARSVDDPATEALRRDVAEARSALAQRDAELTVINSIQQGLVAQLDLTAIVELVG